MAKRNLVSLFILGFLAKSSLAAESFTTKNWPKFAGVEWGSSMEVVKKALEEKGYECRKPTTTDKGVYGFTFTGMLAGREAEGICSFVSKKINLITISYPHKLIDEDFSVKLLRILKGKYGMFKQSRSTDGTLNCVWFPADDENQIALVYQVSTTEVTVTYVSSELSDEANNRAEKELEQSKKSEEDF